MSTRLQIWKIVMSAGLSAIQFSSCASGDTGDISFSMSFDSDTQQLLQDGKPTTARVLYSYDGMNGAVMVQPATTVPLAVDPSSSSPQYRWETSTSEGYPIEGNLVQLAGVPLGQTNMMIAIELLQRFDIQGGGSQEYVVAYYCYLGPPTPLTAAQFQADAKGVYQFVKGRTCGTCPGQRYQGFDPSPPQGGKCP